MHKIMTDHPQFQIHLLADETGETAIKLLRAAIMHFPGIQHHENIWSLVRTQGHLEKVMKKIEKNPGMVIFTIANTERREELEKFCRKQKLPHLGILDETVNVLEQFFGKPASNRPQSSHKLDKAYYQRIEAMDFTMRHDDGLSPETVDQADVIIIGVSRTSKSPTSVYMANRGLKVANIPFVREDLIPEKVKNIDNTDLNQPFVVGLQQTARELVQVRRNRLDMLNEGTSTYADPFHVREEIRQAEIFCRKHNWPMIRVTEKSIEETAAEIIQLYEKSGRKGVVVYV